MTFVKAPARQREGSGGAVTVPSEMIAKARVCRVWHLVQPYLEWGIWSSLAHEGFSSMGGSITEFIIC